jgi:N-acetylneuraminic acid mutarotase
MTGWTADTSYPQPIAEQSCVSYQSDVYCVGGSYNDAEDDIASSYFAPLNGTGIGSWVSTTSYPVPIGGQSCVSSSGYIYCVGGENETDGTNATLAQSNSDWYAQLSSSGIGVWKQTTSYPQGTDYASCAATSTMVYCIGGQDASGNGVDNVYFAPISSSGIGAWSGSTAYPIKVGGQSCVTDSGSIICVGGLTNVSASGTGIDAVYSATILAGGVGSWQQDSSFPVDAETLCTLVTGNLYCTGGYQNGSSASEIWSDFTYYASVQSQLE